MSKSGYIDERAFGDEAQWSSLARLSQSRGSAMEAGSIPVVSMPLPHGAQGLVVAVPRNVWVSNPAVDCQYERDNVDVDRDRTRRRNE